MWYKLNVNYDRGVDGDISGSALMSFFAQLYASLDSDKKSDKDFNWLYDLLVNPRNRTLLKKQVIPELGTISDTWCRVLRPLWSFYCKFLID